MEPRPISKRWPDMVVLVGCLVCLCCALAGALHADDAPVTTTSASVACETKTDRLAVPSHQERQ